MVKTRHPPADIPIIVEPRLAIEEDDLARWQGEFGLNDRQVLWAVHYSEHRNARLAARQAGYAAKGHRASAFHNARHPGCKALVTYLDREKMVYVVVTAADVLARSLEIYQLAKIRKDLPSMVRANEQMGKHRDVRAFIQNAEDLTPPKLPPDIEALLEKLEPDEFETLMQIRAKLVDIAKESGTASRLTH